ncbi:MAG TPA: GAF domain-containing protein [Myxococcota bacterium]|nr:GAF domain-containing protein [Myxococcota bacterium]
MARLGGMSSDDRSDKQEEDSPLASPAASLSEVLLAGTRDLALNLPRKIFEIDFDLSDSREELKKKVAWIIRIRFAINPAVVLLMFFSNWQGLTRGASTLSRETLISTALVAIVSIVLNLAYFYALRHGSFELRKFVVLQLLLDVIIFSAYFWRTGGVTSPFAFLYFLPIIGGNMLLSPAAGMAMAGVGSLAYISIIVLESTGLIPHISYFVGLDRFAQRTSYIVLMSIVNLFAFLVVAAASGFLMRTVSQKARELKESNLLQERKAKLFTMLYKVSEILQRHEGMDQVLDRICDVLVIDMNVDRALMYIIHGDELKLRRVAYHERVPESDRAALRVSIPLDPAEGLTARSAIENMPYNVADAGNQQDINIELAKKIGLNPFALAPMSFRGKVLGILGIDRSRNFSAISDDEFQVLQIFARQAGQTIATAGNS